VAAHRLRHTFSECLDAAGATLQDLAEALGHRDAETSRRWYLKHTESLDRIRRILDSRFPPKGDAGSPAA